MPIIDKRGKKTKYRYTISGRILLGGNYSFEHEVQAENEEDARRIAEEMAIEDLDDNSCASEYHDGTEYDSVVQGEEIQVDPEPAPPLSSGNLSSNLLDLYDSYINRNPSGLGFYTRLVPEIHPEPQPDPEQTLSNQTNLTDRATTPF